MYSFQSQRLLTGGVLVALLAGLNACAGVHRFDETQVPVISVSSGPRPVISWTPADAYQLNVYAGASDGDGLGVLWNARSERYANDLRAPVTYGVPPAGTNGRAAPPLQPGMTYTVVVVRKDPLGSGDGFTNTRHRYAGKKTFVP